MNILVPHLPRTATGIGECLMTPRGTSWWSTCYNCQCLYDNTGCTLHVKETFYDDFIHALLKILREGKTFELVDVNTPVEQDSAFWSITIGKGVCRK